MESASPQISQFLSWSVKNVNQSNLFCTNLKATMILIIGTQLNMAWLYFLHSSLKWGQFCTQLNLKGTYMIKTKLSLLFKNKRKWKKIKNTCQKQTKGIQTEARPPQQSQYPKRNDEPRNRTHLLLLNMLSDHALTHASSALHAALLYFQNKN